VGSTPFGVICTCGRNPVCAHLRLRTYTFIRTRGPPTPLPRVSRRATTFVGAEHNSNMIGPTSINASARSPPHNRDMRPHTSILGKLSTAHYLSWEAGATHIFVGGRQPGGASFRRRAGFVAAHIALSRRLSKYAWLAHGAPEAAASDLQTRSPSGCPHDPRPIAPRICTLLIMPRSHKQKSYCSSCAHARPVDRTYR